MILDSNIVIYSSQPNAAAVRQFLATGAFAASVVSRVEVLGYHRITPAELRHYEAVFKTLTLLPVSAAVIQRAIALRQSKKMKLGDALIAATALAYAMPLVTRNTTDFANIAGLSVINPVP